MRSGARHWFERRGRGTRARWSLCAAAVLWLQAAAAAAATAPRLDPEFPAPGAALPAAAPVASRALVENAARWDGRVISFAGEVVGEALVRGDQVWLQVNDDAYQRRGTPAGRPLQGYNSGQAIWAPLALARRVRRFGDHRTAGDAVLVSGEFHAACREHGGDMDIHAAGLEVVREGRAIDQRLNGGRLGLGLGLLALAGTLWWLRRRAGAPGML